MRTAHSLILTLNGGSSSIKFAFYDASEPMQRCFDGKLDRIGLSGASLTWADRGAKPEVSHSIDVPKGVSAPQFLVDWLVGQRRFEAVAAVGHRIVHGMQHSLPERVNAELLQELHQISPHDPEHLPLEIELIEVLQQRHPRLPQWVCFDTAFHHDMPRVATLLPIPRRFDARGMRRYGFHGLSYAYLMAELVRLAEPAATEGRVILAHLGNGASLAAVRDGKSMDTSMGFTPASGLVMGTRSGDLDPGVAHFLFRTEQISGPEFYALATRESGLLGVSETSSDMRDLLAREGSDVRAAEAVALFCYQAKKWIGAYAAALGGLDALVFSGGIGENCPAVRERICEGLGFLGILLDASDNGRNSPVISMESGRVTVRVIRTDEELMIARSVASAEAANPHSDKVLP